MNDTFVNVLALLHAAKACWCVLNCWDVCGVCSLRHPLHAPDPLNFWILLQCRGISSLIHTKRIASYIQRYWACDAVHCTIMTIIDTSIIHTKHIQTRHHVDFRHRRAHACKSNRKRAQHNTPKYVVTFRRILGPKCIIMMKCHSQNHN